MHAQHLEQLKKKYDGKVRWLTVYIAEAHASDEWTLRDDFNAELDGKWDVPVARTMDQRLHTAREWVDWLNPSMEYVVDKMDDNARRTYAAWPERLVVIENGVVQYYGKQGPWGYDTDEVGAWLEQRFAGATTSKI